MIGTVPASGAQSGGAAIGSFIDRIVAASEASALRDRDVLLDRMRIDDPEATVIDRADSTYYAEVVRRESLRRRRTGAAHATSTSPRSALDCSR